MLLTISNHSVERYGFGKHRIVERRLQPLTKLSGKKERKKKQTNKEKKEQQR